METYRLVAISLLSAACCAAQTEDGPTARLLMGIAVSAQESGDLPRAEKLNREALAAFAAQGASDGRDGLRCLVNLGVVLSMEGKFADSEQIDRIALAKLRAQPLSEDYAAALNGLGNALAKRGRAKEAAEAFRQAIAIWERLLGSNHPNLASSLMNLGSLLAAEHRYGEAEALMDRALAIDARNFSADHTRIAIDLNDEAGLLLDRKQWAEAERLLLRAASILEQSALLSNGRPSNATLGEVWANLGEVYRRERRLEESRDYFERGIKILDLQWGSTDPRLLVWLGNYASVLRSFEEYTEAGKLELQATRIRVIEARRRAG